MDAKSSLSGQIELDAVMAAYQAAVLAGGAPDREQLIAGHPELAEPLREFFRLFDLKRAATERTDADRFAATWTAVDADDGSGNESAPGQLISDRYRLIERIGEGGMGAVWLAEQLSPVKRKVAIKLIKAGMDSRQVLARFDAERQALAVMDHPGIAKVFDGGLTAAGRPYFVMEHVAGIPLPQYCDQERLSPRSRVQLMIDVCFAVQHAHQKGIIHRDLKPSNILALKADGGPVVKVIDFGLAKAIHAPLTEQSLHTEHGAIVGTPLYMSPEQASRQRLDVDTRSDIYSLGVLLYELLTGTTPLERLRLQQAAPWDLPRLILEYEVPRPSARLDACDAKAQIAARRGCDARQLLSELSGDLEWVVMRSLEKDRNRRYDTAADFARDLERFLNEEPVEASPPSKTYRLRKLVRKHRGKVAVAGAGLGLLVAAVCGTSWGWLRSESFRKRAEELLQIKDEAEALMLRNVRESTDDVVEHLIGSQPVLGPQERAYLERSLARWQVFANRQGDDRLNRMYRAEGHRNLGFLWYRLGRQPEAFASYQAAHDLLEPLLASDGQNRDLQWNLSIVLLNLGSLHYDLGGFDKSQAAFHRAQSLTRRLLASVPDDPDYRRNLAASHNNLGRLYRDLSDDGAAEREFLQACDIQRELVRQFPDVAEYREDLSFSHMNRAELLLRRGARDEADLELQAAKNLLAALCEQFPGIPRYEAAAARALHLSAGSLTDEGQTAAARAALEEVCAIRERLLSAWPSVLEFRREQAQSLNDLAMVLDQQGEVETARRLLNESRALHLELVRETPDSHQSRLELATSRNNLGAILMRLEKLDEAQREFELAAELQRALLRDVPELAGCRRNLSGTLTNLADTIRFQGAAQSSVPIYDEAIQWLESDSRPTHDLAREGKSLLLSAVRGRAAAWRSLEQHAHAAEDWSRCIELAPVSVQHQFAIERADALLRSGEISAALEMLDELVRRAEKGPDGPALSLDNWYHLACLYSLASVKAPAREQRTTEALRLLRYVANKGYINSEQRAHVLQDRDLDPLRDLPEFQELMSTYQVTCP